MNEKKRDLLQSLVSELQESEEIQDISLFTASKCL